MKPTDFPWIPSLDDETELYTQWRKVSEPKANYKFKLITLYYWLRAKLGLTVVIDFPTPVLVWNCPHMMGRRPQIKCVDQSGNLLFGDWQYIDNNNEKVTFSVARAGKAIFS